MESKWTPEAESQIEEIIASTYGKVYTTYGLRVVGLGFNAKRYLKVGEIAPVSYRWDDHQMTEEELPGTCALEVWDEEIERGMLRTRNYHGGQIVLLGGTNSEYGEDEGEIVIEDARVLATWMR